MPQFNECVGEDISSRIPTVLVDPIRGFSDQDVFPIINGQTGEILMKLPTPNVVRLNRSKFRALIAEGLDIQVSRSGLALLSNRTYR